MSDDAKAMLGDTSAAACGQRMRAVREAFGMTKLELATHLGRDESAVRHVERGRNYPPPHLIGELFKPYGVTLDFIFLGEWRDMRAETWALIRARL